MVQQLTSKQFIDVHCANCHFCRKDCKTAAIGRWKSCLSEHKASKCPTLGYYGKDRSYSKFPRELQVNLHRRTLANNAGWWPRVRLGSEELMNWRMKKKMMLVKKRVEKKRLGWKMMLMTKRVGRRTTITCNNTRISNRGRWVSNMTPGYKPSLACEIHFYIKNHMARDPLGSNRCSFTFIKNVKCRANM